MQPDVQSSVRLKQNRGPEASAARAFAVGDDVLVSNFGGDGGKWIRGLIAEVAGSANYRVKLEDGRVVHRHTDQIVLYHATDESMSDDAEDLLQQIPPSLLEQQLPGVAVEPAIRQEPVNGETAGQSSSEMELTGVQGEPAEPAAVGASTRTAGTSPPTQVESSVTGRRQPGQAGLSVSFREPLERRVPSARVKQKPGWLRDYEE